MQIVLEPGASARLADAGNFHAFHVLVAGPRCDAAALRAMAGAAGTIEEIDGAPYLWVTRTWLDAQGPGGADWAQGMAGMIAFAQPRGWVRPDGAVRAHVEWADGGAPRT